MILMCEVENRSVIPDGYVTMGKIIKYLNQIFGGCFTKDDAPYLHTLFQSKKNILSKKITRPGYNRLITFYYEKPFKNMAERPEEFKWQIEGLRQFLFQEDFYTEPNPTSKAITKQEKEEIPYDETNMDFVNRQLLNKYQYD